MLATDHQSPIESVTASKAAVACDHERELAELLLRHLGAAGAARACRDNNWQGVLHILEGMPAAH